MPRDKEHRKKNKRSATTGRIAASVTNNSIKKIRSRIDIVVQKQGRRPRILLVHLEPHQPDSWTKPLAAALAEFGFDVDISPKHPAPLEAARLAIDNDAHMVCVSIADSANLVMVIQLAEALKEENSTNIRLAVTGTIFQSNPDILYHAGVDLLFDFDAPHAHLANRLLDLIL